jgi:C-terminal processing protease CtpA/Prc
MTNQTQKITVMNKLAKGEPGIRVQDSSGKKNKTIESGGGKQEFFFPRKPSEENYLLLTLAAKPGDSTPACKVGIPANIHYELNPGGLENIKVFHEERKFEENGSTKKRTYSCMHIPGNAPSWKIKLKDPLTTGDGDPVTVEPPEKGPGFGPNYKDFFDRIKKRMKGTMLLKDFLKKQKTKSSAVPKGQKEIEQRGEIIEQAIVLIDHIYVHLRQKRSMYAVDPIQRLKLLKNRNSKLDDMTFHKEMMSIFKELRDLHTIYIPPSPYKNAVVYLPFLIEEFYVEYTDTQTQENYEVKKYMVSKVAEDIKSVQLVDVLFEKEAIITHWNGIPIEQAVELNGEQNAGGNESAWNARGLERMTIRPLNICFIPSESWVDITYLDKDEKETHNLRFKWCAAEWPEMEEEGISCIDRIDNPNTEVGNNNFTAVGADFEGEMVRRTKKTLFAPEPDQKKEDNTASGESEEVLELFDRKQSEKMPDIFAFGKTRADGFGYIRIYSFDVNDANKFVWEFNRIVASIRPGDRDGLIIDVRGNGGGSITAAESLLQVLASYQGGSIERTRFQFSNSPLTLELCSKNNLQRWKKSIANFIPRGALFSQSLPLPLPEDRGPTETNNYSKSFSKSFPKVFFKRFVLITDALCYSATEVFAAGFKDNEIGKIIGVHKRTGGGGASVWTHGQLIRDINGNSNNSKSLIKPLPVNCDFRVAVCRATRVKEKIGIPIEDLGVEADCVYHMTKDDLLEKNSGLIRAAVDTLNGAKCEGGEILATKKGEENSQNK